MRWYILPDTRKRKSDNTPQRENQPLEEHQGTTHTKVHTSRQQWEQEKCDEGFHEFFTQNPDAQLTDSQIAHMQEEFIDRAYGTMYEEYTQSSTLGHGGKHHARESAQAKSSAQADRDHQKMMRDYEARQKAHTQAWQEKCKPVSYTHLTLPTIA